MHNHFVDQYCGEHEDDDDDGSTQGNEINGGNGQENGDGGVLLQPLNGPPASTMATATTTTTGLPVVVSYRPGASTRTSTIPHRTCYCQSNRKKKLLLILTAAILVLGTTIGALIMYFTGNFQCGTSTSEGKLIIVYHRRHTKNIIYFDVSCVLCAASDASVAYIEAAKIELYFYQGCIESNFLKIQSTGMDLWSKSHLTVEGNDLKIASYPLFSSSFVFFRH